MDLTSRWVTTLVSAGGAADPTLGRSLQARYAEPHRQYHGLAHLEAVLSTVDLLEPHATDADLVRIAAWYHDAIYDPRRVDNEERSALLAEDELPTTGMGPAKLTAIARLIRVTADHAAPAGNADAEVLCDADLVVLASPAQSYASYVAAVRREYSHVDEPSWRAGRGAVLHGLLARPQLFRTPPGRAWEHAARINLTGELAGLESPSGAAAPLP